MPTTIQDILDIINTTAPANLAEPWDNVGLMIGSLSSRVDSILIGLDPTLQLLEEAERNDSNLVITHHPIIFHPLKSIQFEQPDGRFINKAIQKNINVISCHTNLDSTAPGVSDILAKKLGLTDLHPLAGNEGSDNKSGLGRIGIFQEPIDADFLIKKLQSACNTPWLLEAGPRPTKINKAAVCGGSGSDLAQKALASGAQVFITGEVKHSIARWAEETGFWIIDAGHFATENPAMTTFAQQLSSMAQERKIEIDIRVTSKQESPLKLI